MDACATPQWRPRHELDLDGFLERTASRNGLPAGGWAVGRVVNNRLHDVRARFKISSQ